MALSPLRSIALKIDQTPMIFKTVGNLAEFLSKIRSQGKAVSLVPTMGNLHQEH